MAETRKKLLLVIPTLDRSGAEKQLTLLATHLPKDQFDVHVAVLTRDGPYSENLRESGIPYTLIGKKTKLSFLAYWKLKRLIQEFKPDIVHTWLFAANAYGRKAAQACHVPMIICGERCVDPWKSSLHFMIDRSLARKTDFIAVNSEGIREFYCSHGLPRDQFVVIPNAVIPIRRSPWTRERLLAELNLTPQEGETAPVLIGMVARLWAQKRIKEALWSFDQLNFAGLNFHAIIIGDGPERDDLLRYRDHILLQDRVHFIGHQKDVSLFMSHFDLLWCTSAYEGQSNSILEAMSAGVPVFASDIPGNRELVVPGRTGLLIPEFDGDIQRRRTAFVKETLSFFLPENEELRKSYGQAASTRIQNEFNLKKMIERHIQLYTTPVARKE